MATAPSVQAHPEVTYRASASLPAIGVVLSDEPLRNRVLTIIHQVPAIAITSSHASGLSPTMQCAVIGDRDLELLEPTPSIPLLVLAPRIDEVRIRASQTTDPDTMDLLFRLVRRVHLRALNEGRHSGTHTHHASGHPNLSQREAEVLAGLIAGHTRGQVARRLGLSIHTVDTYLRRLKEKMRARSLTDLVRIGASGDF